MDAGAVRDKTVFELKFLSLSQSIQITQRHKESIGPPQLRCASESLKLQISHHELFLWRSDQVIRGSPTLARDVPVASLSALTSRPFPPPTRNILVHPEPGRTHRKQKGTEDKEEEEIERWNGPGSS